MTRRLFSLGNHGSYTSFQQTERAMAAEAINKALDDGFVVTGRLNPDADEWMEIDECLEPKHWSILCRMKDGSNKEIHGYKIDRSKSVSGVSL